MTTIDDIKNQLDIVDVISESVKLRRSGKNYTGFCPFHANTRTPAFVVFPATGTWRCFGECNEGGDIFRFVMKKEGVDFREALKMLADRAGVQLEPLTPQKKVRNEREEYIRKILDEAVIFYRHQLLSTERGKEAQNYLRDKRGIKATTEEIWGLGYAPGGWDAALNYFKNKGYPIKDILEAGLLTEKQDGKVYDRFRHRIMFPIRNMSGQMVGFGGRVLDPNDLPKFINSPQSILFDKSKVLYGLDKARKSIRSKNQAVIVEGYFDVMVVHQEGFHNVISPMGTALTEIQMRLLKRFTRRFVMALDPDAAGQKATLRGLEVARDALDHDSEPVFDARGLLHHESRLRADLRVSTLPEDLDPDEIVLQNQGDWDRIIQTAKPIIYHVLDSLTAGQDLDDPKVKSTIVAQILPLVKDVPNPVERDAYRQQIARVLKVDETAMQEVAVPVRRSRRRKLKSPQSSDQPLKIDQIIINEQEKLKLVERAILSYLIRKPESKYKIDRFLRSNGLEKITTADFTGTENQHIAEIVFDSLSQEDMEPVDYVSSRIKEESILIDYDQVLPSESDNEEKKSGHRQLEETARLIMQSRQLSINLQIKDYRFLQSNIDNEISTEQDAFFQRQLFDLIRIRGLLDRGLSKPIILD